MRVPSDFWNSRVTVSCVMLDCMDSLKISLPLFFTFTTNWAVVNTPKRGRKVQSIREIVIVIDVCPNNSRNQEK